MFDGLSDRLGDALKKIKGQGRLTEANIKEGLREVRMALLEADVNYKVVKDLIDSIRERAVGRDVMSSLTPGQQVVKIVYEELTAVMGGFHQGLDFSGRPPWTVMLVGLQGSGKTTTAGKLALYLKGQGRKPLLVPADVYRPAAIDQLQRLAEQVGVPAFPSTSHMDPVDIARDAWASVGQYGADTIILDTAGRLHIDEQLMDELKTIRKLVNPNEVLLVADAMTGQEAVNVASTFNEWLNLTGVVLTKMEGDARGGAALSIKAVVDRPLKFVGVGEKLDALEAFHPDRVASRILGMGDVLSLIEKAQANVDEKEALELARKLRKDEFTLEDFQKQITQLKKMGSIESLLGMIPGLGKLKKLKEARPEEGELKKIEAIISSMTRAERLDHTLLNAGRRKRIAKGSGTSVADVNTLIKNFIETKKMMRKFAKGAMPNMNRGGFPFRK